MAPTLCLSCASTRAVMKRPSNGHPLCKACFLRTFEDEVHQTIVSNSLFERGERVAIGASGGKDSTVLAAVLKELNERYDYGVDFMLLSVDEGITGYRDDSLETVKQNAKDYGMQLEIVSYADLYGWTMDRVVETIGKKGNCTYCGVFRRQALDRGALKLGVKHVVTGHNADDVAETVFMNCRSLGLDVTDSTVLRADLPRLSRASSIITKSSLSQTKRSKPLMYAYEKEIVLYAHHRKLLYFSTECIYSPEAFRGSARALIKDLERIRPSAILDVVKSGQDLMKMVPAEFSGRVVPEEDEAGPCGGGQEGGGEMARVERVLAVGTDLEKLKLSELHPANADVSALEARETDFTSVSIRKSLAPSIRSTRTVKDASKKPRQVMQNCSKCGYISSQALCKACVLLEGLNRTRPKVEIEIGKT